MVRVSATAYGVATRRRLDWRHATSPSRARRATGGAGRPTGGTTTAAPMGEADGRRRHGAGGRRRCRGRHARPRLGLGVDRPRLPLRGSGPRLPLRGSVVDPHRRGRCAAGRDAGRRPAAGRRDPVGHPLPRYREPAPGPARRPAPGGRGRRGGRCAARRHQRLALRRLPEPPDEPCGRHLRLGGGGRPVGRRRRRRTSPAAPSTSGPPPPRRGWPGTAPPTGCARPTATSPGTTSCARRRSAAAVPRCTPTRRRTRACSSEQGRGDAARAVRPAGCHADPDGAACLSRACGTRWRASPRPPPG